MRFPDASFLTFFGVFLPTWDVYSDIAFSIKLIVNEHKIWGMGTLCPVIIKTILLLPHWWRMENDYDNRFSTFLLLIFQVWPQVRAVRLIYTGWKMHKNWPKEKSLYDNRVYGIGNNHQMDF